MAKSHYKMLRTRDMEAAAAKVLANEGVSPAMLGQRLSDQDPDSRSKKSNPGQDKFAVQDRFDALGLNYDLGDRLIQSGQLGICMVDAAEGDFVHFAYLCDRYKSRIKVDGAEKADELSEEARERIYGGDK